MSHRHSDGKPFRPSVEYDLNYPCRQCGAAPGASCRRLKGPKTGPHVARLKRGTNHLYRDQRAAPWSSEMIPGACYSTLPGCE